VEAPHLAALSGADAPSSLTASAAPTPSSVGGGGGGGGKARSLQAALPRGDGAVGSVEGGGTRTADHSGSPGDDGEENATDWRGGTRSGSALRRQGGGGLVRAPYGRRADSALEASSEARAAAAGGHRRERGGGRRAVGLPPPAEVPSGVLCQVPLTTVAQLRSGPRLLPLSPPDSDAAAAWPASSATTAVAAASSDAPQPVCLLCMNTPRV